MPEQQQTKIIAGDIGGTKTLLGYFTIEQGVIQSRVIKKYYNQQYNQLEEIIRQFISEHQLQFNKLCLGIAGPVMNGKVQTTNLSWEISTDQLSRSFTHTKIKLINDLSATAYAVPFLEENDLLNLTPHLPSADPHLNIAIVAPGTGLGGAILNYHKKSYQAIVSEAGHIDFSPQNNEEITLLKFLMKKYGHVSEERIVSGPGLINIFEWLTKTKQISPSRELKSAIGQNGPKAITRAALEENNPDCLRILEVFIKSMGSFAGNLVLTAMTIGGLYLGGGIVPHLVPLLQKKTFLDSFIQKGRFTQYLQKIPVKVILNDHAALLGAAWYAKDHI